jgi:YidC/Oxa1 family membrane protein insertase
MEKRTIIAIALSVVVLFFFQYFVQKRVVRTPPARPAVQTKDEAVAPPAPSQPAAAEAAPVPSSAADTKASARTVVVQGDIYRAVLDNRGAVLTSWMLNQYKSAKGQIFEMIAPNRAGESWVFPGSMIFKDPALTNVSNNELYEVSVEGGQNAEIVLKPPVTVVMKLKRSDVTIEKSFSFEKNNYVVDLSGTFQKGGQNLEGQFFLGQDIGPELEHLVGSAQLEAVYYQGGKAKRESAPKEENDIKKIEGDIRWVGLDMHYFSAIAIPEQSFSSFDIQKRAVKAVGLDGKEVNRDLLRVKTPVNGSLRYQLYLGPKKQSNLEAVKKGDITGVINYGMFSILVRPLLWSLQWIHQYAHNYGTSIIILTFLLSLLLFPFRLKQMVSMKKMQVVQPKVKAIQEKYRRYKKTDPKRAEMNQEIMALYKEHNVNPLGGCLPLLLQMPLLFAFYSLLAYSIELRQAPFIGWLQDLSVSDPWFVLPIVMGISMFISQKMTPMAPGSDPTQAKVMMFMPVIFTFMFLKVSSGLNLYFLCSNIFQIAFQKIAERWIGDGKANGEAKS